MDSVAWDMEAFMVDLVDLVVSVTEVLVTGVSVTEVSVTEVSVTEVLEV